jgi:ribosomal protein S18 acetylase RimI-like enzyme
MKDFIPENILVYIAVDNSQRGKGYGKQLMQKQYQLLKEI